MQDMATQLCANNHAPRPAGGAGTPPWSAPSSGTSTCSGARTTRLEPLTDARRRSTPSYASSCGWLGSARSAT